MASGKEENAAGAEGLVLRVKHLGEQRHAVEEERGPLHGSPYAQRHRKLGTRAGKVLSAERDLDEVQPDVRREVSIARALRELERSAGMRFGRVELAGHRGHFDQVGKQQPARGGESVTLGDRQRFRKVRAGGNVVPLDEIQRGEVVQAQRLSGGVARAPMRRERLQRQLQRLGIVAHHLLDQRQVVEHARRALRIHARKPELARLREAPLRVGEPPEARRRLAEDVEALRLPVAIARGARGVQPPRGERLRLGVAIEPIQKMRGRCEQERRELRVGHDGVRAERLAEQSGALREPGAVIAEMFERPGAAAQPLPVVVRDRPPPGRLAVVEFGVELLQAIPVTRVRPERELAEQPEKVRGMRTLRDRARLPVSEAERGELPHHRMHEDARILLAQERLVGECTEHGHGRGRHRAARLGREPAVKDRKARQRVALRRAQEPPRLVEHDRKARVPVGLRGVDGVQKLGAVPKLGCDRIARKDARPRGRELEGQRQALDLAADVDDRQGLDGWHKRRLHPLRGLNEQARRVERLQVVAILQFGARQPFDRQQPFARRGRDARARSRRSEAPGTACSSCSRTEAAGSSCSKLSRTRSVRRSRRKATT